jgi:hypothetical protein
VTDVSRRAYLGLGYGFLVLGLVVAALALLDLVAGLDLFRGSPLGTALFLALIGGLLIWTVRQADRQRRVAEGETGEVAGTVAEDADRPYGDGPPRID